jgi:hypothetical protein
VEDEVMMMHGMMHCDDIHHVCRGVHNYWLLVMLLWVQKWQNTYTQALNLTEY